MEIRIDILCLGGIGYEKGYLSLMITGLVSGVLSGIIASACFMFILYGVRPKISISEKVIFEKAKEGSIIQIKVANMTKKMINNVDYALYYCLINEDGINDIKEIPARKSILRNIARYDKHDEDAEYAIRITFNANDLNFPLDENDKLIFVINAKHSVSNTSVCKIKEYYRDDIFNDGFFESKTSMKVISRH